METFNSLALDGREHIKVRSPDVLASHRLDRFEKVDSPNHGKFLVAHYHYEGEPFSISLPANYYEKLSDADIECINAKDVDLINVGFYDGANRYILMDRSPDALNEWPTGEEVHGPFTPGEREKSDIKCTFVLTRKNNVNLCWEGFLYHYHTPSKHGLRTWWCSNYHCSSKIMIIGWDDRICKEKSRFEHNHEPRRHPLDSNIPPPKKKRKRSWSEEDSWFGDP